MPDDPTLDPQPEAGDALALSPLDELRAEFAKEAEKPRLFQRFPARSGRLAGEYAPLSKNAALRATEGAQDAAADAGILASSLRCILIHDPAHGSADGRGLVPFGAWSGQPDLDPLGFDHRLAELIGIPPGDTTSVVLALFEGNDLALANHAGAIGAWSVNTRDQSYQDFTQGS